MPSAKQFFIALSFFLFLSSALAQERYVYVAEDGSSSADAKSWATATTLQAALSRYKTNDILLVKAGTYTPTMANGAVASDLRDGTYALPDGVRIYGGFAGTEKEPEDRDTDLIATTNQTLIEGNIGDLETNTDNLRHLFTLQGEGEATLDGLTVARGYTMKDGESGAGLHAGPKGRVNLRRCRFIGNESSGGGAIYVGGTLTVTKSSFERNTAAKSSGGAIYAGGTLTVTKSSFERNTAAKSSGGAIYAGGTLTVTKSSFERNTSNGSSGGAIYAGGTLTVAKSSFERNTSNGNSGGAIYVGGMLTVAKSSFERNTATKDSGGAIYAGGMLTVTKSSFEKNTAPSGSGGAIFGEMLTVTKSSFEGNSAGKSSGGAVYVNGALIVTKSSFNGNSGTAIFGETITLTKTNLEGKLVTRSDNGAIYSK